MRVGPYQTRVCVFIFVAVYCVRMNPCSVLPYQYTATPEAHSSVLSHGSTSLEPASCPEGGLPRAAASGSGAQAAAGTATGGTATAWVAMVRFRTHFDLLALISRVSTLRMQLQPGICPSPVLRFWGKMTMSNAGTMAYRRDFPSTTRI